MAEQNVRWPQDATQLTKAEITPNTPLMAADSADDEKLAFITHEQLADSIAEIIEINGIEVKPIAGGATEATAVVLAAGPAGENRKMAGVTGWFKNATGPAWEAPIENSNVNWWDGSTWSLGSSQPLPEVQPDGSVIAGDTNAVSGDTVYKSINPLDTAINGGNIPFGIMQDISTYNITDTNEYCEVNLRKPAPRSGKLVQVNIRASKIGDIRIAAFKDETPSGATIVTLRNMLEVTVNCATTGVNSFTDGVHFNNLNVEAGWYPGVRKMTGGALPYRIALTTGTKGAARLASTTAPVVGAASNMGTHPIEFAIEFIIEYEGIDSEIDTIHEDIDNINSELEDSLTKSDLTLTESVNLANPDERILGSFIDSAGNIGTGAGWEMIKIDTSEYPVGQEISFGNMTISTGHCAWYNGTTKISYAGSYATANLPKTVLKPTNGNILYITTMRSNIANPNLMVNKGATLLPYQPYQTPKVTEIAGYPLEGSGGGGSNTFDQDLNTTNSVRFAFVTAAGAKFERPVWDEVSPTTVIPGDEYLFPDGNGNYFNKTRG